MKPESDGGGDVDPSEITLIVSQLRTGDFDSALENVRRLQKDHPDNARLLVLAGIAHLGREEKELAETAFSRAVELDPGSADARLNLARLRTQEGDLNAAKGRRSEDRGVGKEGVSRC